MSLSFVVLHDVPCVDGIARLAGKAAPCTTDDVVIDQLRQLRQQSDEQRTRQLQFNVSVGRMSV